MNVTRTKSQSAEVSDRSVQANQSPEQSPKYHYYVSTRLLTIVGECGTMTL